MKARRFHARGQGIPANVPALPFEYDMDGARLALHEVGANGHLTPSPLVVIAQPGRPRKWEYFGPLF
jgi:hypothetical protein